jgi:hypothetical protein
MAQGRADTSALAARGDTEHVDSIPTPSMSFRRRAWLLFQRALDPLAPPRPLPMKRRK